MKYSNTITNMLIHYIHNIDEIPKNHRIEPVAFTFNIILAIAVEDGVFNKYIVYFADCL